MVENRQHDDGCLYKQPGGNSLTGARSPHSRPMDVVPRDKHPDPHKTPPWSSEHGRRQGIEVDERLAGLETICGDFQ